MTGYNCGFLRLSPDLYYVQKCKKISHIIIIIPIQTTATRNRLRHTSSSKQVHGTSCHAFWPPLNGKLLSRATKHFQRVRFQVLTACSYEASKGLHTVQINTLYPSDSRNLNVYYHLSYYCGSHIDNLFEWNVVCYRQVPLFKRCKLNYGEWHIPCNL
jgi:hypothetical protein